MPYEIKKHGNKFSVINVQTHHIFSKNSTKKNAVKQERLLRGLEHGMILKSIPKKKK
jgi:hypothetical protein